MLIEVTNHILNQLPEKTKLTTEDIVVIQSHHSFFLDLIDPIIIDFFDTLYANPETKVIFKEGERPIREKTLKSWFIETIDGNFDLGYWSWQTFIGIMHVKRKVKNNMMIAMMSRVSDIILTDAILKMSQEDVIKLKSAWLKLSNTVLALISESYSIFYLKAVGDATGLTAKLIENTVKVEIDNLIDEYSGFSRHR